MLLGAEQQIVDLADGGGRSKAPGGRPQEAGSSSPSMSETSAHCSLVGMISGALRSPREPAWRRTTERAKEWNVRTSTLPAPGSLAVTRARISSAARRENVRARMRSGLTPLSAYEVRDPLDQNPGLARARPGEHEERSARMLDGLELILVQVRWGLDHAPSP